MALNETPAEAAGLYSTLRNMLYREVYIGFIGNHGKRIAAGEEVTVFGDIQNVFYRQTPNDRGRRSLQNMLKNDQLVIVKSPSVYLYDATTDETKILTLNNGSFAAADPLWGSYSSSASGLSALV